MDIIKKIQDWYKSNCNGDWEHSYGIEIETLDNPGWSVEIDLNDTKCADKNFSKINIKNGDDDWIICKVSKNKFIGHGDPDKLETILKTFLNFCNREKGSALEC
ncbi:MAG: immunity 53 family protein [Candidatus Omnitrophota bacterium]|nr:immunity 53 family protein [Candidatus Omnitrophota bacterium]